MEFKLDQAIEVLERTPGILRAWLEGFPDPWLSADEGPETFNPLQVLGHLVHGEETDWIPRAWIILEDGETRPFTPFDRFGFKEKHQGRSVAELLELFATLRRENLHQLKSWSLRSDQLELKGKHPEFGVVTLRQLLATWVVHDLSHLSQIARVMSKQYKDEVGPWGAYLRILHG